MSKYKYPGFDKLEEDSVLFRALPLCDILKLLLGERDFSYISSAQYPLELTELILHYLKYEKNVATDVIDSFLKKYLTEDPLCQIDKLLSIWGDEKFEKMISELKMLTNN